jgi:hypothetical protein
VIISTVSVKDFTYTRTHYSDGQAIGHVQQCEGQVIVVPAPFGRHLTISLFGGELNVTYIECGGHCVSEVLIVQRVDDSIRVMPIPRNGEKVFIKGAICEVIGDDAYKGAHPVLASLGVC